MIKPADATIALPIASIRLLEKQGLDAGLPLMQRAGNSAARFLHQRLNPKSHVLALVGPGNNGGDALVTATELHALGHELTVVMPLAAPNAPADAKQALMHWLVTGGQIAQTLPPQKPDAVIDGLFGIGLSRTLANPWAAVINTVNSWQVPLLALDIPSGLAADTGDRLGQPIKATWTLSFIAPSLATRMAKNQGFCGQCWVETLNLRLNLIADRNRDLAQ